MDGIVSAFTGKLGQDGELRYTATGKAMLSVSVAVDDRRAVERGDPTTWVRCTVWGDSAEELAPRLKKGTLVYAEGRISLKTWDGPDGEKRSGLELFAWTLQPMYQVGQRRPRPEPSGERRNMTDWEAARQ